MLSSLPQDPDMLVSVINMLLRDGEFDSLDSLCSYFDRDRDELESLLLRHGFVYNEQQRQMRPVM
ncbi:MAG: DUF4250 domain-containing protein [Bacteroidaceae bacterium]|nr:DUF4250 domain-containing protein [Bacteroidaceae bacterium]